MSNAAVLTCCRCGKDESNYLNLQSQISVSKLCGHGLCAGCLSSTFALFSKTSAAAHRGHTTVRCPFPGCDRTLTAQDFTSKRPEEEEFDREKKIRRELGRVFNRSLADFGGDQRKYDDYLETVETYISNLVSGTKVEETEAAIRRYVAANQATIAFNAARQEAAAREIQAKLAADSLQRSEGERRAALDEAGGGGGVGGGAKRATVERVKAQLLQVMLGSTNASDATSGHGASGSNSNSSGSGGGGGADKRLDSKARAQLKARLLELHMRLRQSQGQSQAAGVAAVAAMRRQRVLPKVPTPAFSSSTTSSSSAPASSSSFPRDLSNDSSASLRPAPAMTAKVSTVAARLRTASSSATKVDVDEESVLLGVAHRAGGSSRQALNGYQEAEKLGQLWILPR